MNDTPFTLRDLEEIETELLRCLDLLQHADPRDAERVSWWGGQVVALLWALGASREDAIGAMYEAWRDRGE